VSAAQLAALLADPADAHALDTDAWTGILCAARAERLLASLAHRLDGLALPDSVQSALDTARADAEVGRTEALWEAEMARRVLAPLDVPVVLLKGTAFVAAGLDAGQGRLIGDLDILVPRDRLDEVEAALLAAGWDWVKPDPYDDAYYRRWMHELPPLIHRDRDRMIDVHHTILPPTARPTPAAAALIADSRSLENGLRVLCPEDMIVHAAAHLLADGDLAGGLRNLWDIRCLTMEFGDDPAFWPQLARRAATHGLTVAVERALRLATDIFAAPIPKPLDRWHRQDKWYRARLLARDGWGRPTRTFIRFVFYIRSHWLRMPLNLLLPHIFTKWRNRKRRAKVD
jgi:Uncharacterised nucleotidyltransferase